MDTSVIWINDYLDPPATAEEQADLLTRAGFPLEGSEEIPEASDVRQDFEMTSNRGDCVCHLGLAREIAALSGRTLKQPDISSDCGSEQASDFIAVRNDEHTLCPLYTAQVIRGVKVGPSPKWLADRLIARGDIPRNNVVDATNFVLFEMGQPTHVFDIASLDGGEIRIRRAMHEEEFLPLGEDATPVKLTTDDLVIADARRAVAMAGVKGGADSAVTASTTDIVIEAATFNPVGVRTSSRRHNIASDSSYRFERGVHPAHVAPAAARLVHLILKLAGGTLCEGIVSDGAAIPDPIEVTMRVSRCKMLLGVDITAEFVVDAFGGLGFQPVADGDVVRCTVPCHRGDIAREIDLIEEVARMYGLDRIPMADKVAIDVPPQQARVLARRAVGDALVGMDFVESVTHSLVGEEAAKLFLPPGMDMLRLEDDRAKSEPILRPSTLPSLLRVYAHNRDNGVTDVRFFETASTFAMVGSEHVERVNVGFIVPDNDGASAVRTLRGVLDRLLAVLRGPDARLDVEATDQISWFAPAAVARFDGEVLGTYGLLAPHVAKFFGLDKPVCAGEFGLPALYDVFPPERESAPLPHFPAITRDLSLIVDESVAWATIESTLGNLNLQFCEVVEFVTVFRGKQTGAGKKSVTTRLRFRSPDHTLKHEDVDPQMARAVAALTDAVGAEIRH